MSTVSDEEHREAMEQFETDRINGEIRRHEYGLEVSESFEIDGEDVERETDVSFNRDGSLTLSQRDQTLEVVTVSEPVAKRICEEFEAGELPIDGDHDRGTGETDE